MPSTTNFSWTTPADTDLVKDGALAIRTLGNGIDTSLVDLKGGTTGQALTKATNTDLDYQWTDIIPASNTFFAAKNKLLNSDFAIWQRGTSFTSPASSTYTADRWKQDFAGTPTTWSISRQSFSPGTAPVAGYESSFFLRSTLTTIGTLTVYDISQLIEDVRTFAGQTITISFWAKADSARTLSIYTGQLFGAGGSSAVYTSSQNVSLTNTWQRFSSTFSIASISGKTIGTGSSLQIAFRQPLANGSVLDLWGVQVESGSVSTAFQTATGNPASELAACQRYYWRMTSPAAASPFGNAYATSTTAGYAHINYPVEMRTSSGVTLDYSTIAFYLPGTAVYGATAATISTNTRLMALLNVTGMTGLTANRPYSFTDNNSTNGYIGISAEL